MEEQSEADDVIYVNCPNLNANSQPVTTQPPPSRPVSAVSPPMTELAVDEYKNVEYINGAHAQSLRDLNSFRGSRDWSTDLFYFLKGDPAHAESCPKKTQTALRDCARLSCKMCSLSQRLGDPRGLPFIPCTGPAIRLKVRIMGGIQGSILNDCLVMSCCCPCGVCQMYREFENIGI